MSDFDDMPTFDVEAHSENATKTVVETRGFELTVDESEAMGGTDDGPNPLEYLAGAHAGCLNVTGQIVADDMGLELHGLNIAIEGDFNPAKIEGEPTDDRAGYQEVRVTIEADTSVDEATLEEWIKLVEERCPVSDNIGNTTPIDISVSKS